MGKLNAYPVVPDFEFEEGPKRYAEVLLIVLKKVPAPNDTISWDEVFEFRDNEGTKRQLGALRSFARRVARGSLEPGDIEEEIESSIRSYEEYMSVKKMAHRKSALEIAVVTTAEIAEDLVKIRWGKLAQSLFEIRRRRVQVVEAELHAPGRELAYLVSATERFGSREPVNPRDRLH